MTKQQMTKARKAVIAFRIAPTPERADTLLALLAPLRGYDVIQRLIDEILEYKFLVGSLTSVEEEVAAGG